MSHLANTVSRLMLERKLRAVYLAREVGVDPSLISRLRSHKAERISLDNLASLALALGRDKQERAEIIAAHLKDESCGFYPDFVNISIGGKDSANTELDPDIEYLQSHLSDRSLRRAVQAIVSMHRGGHKNGHKNWSRLNSLGNSRKSARSQ